MKQLEASLSPLSMSFGTALYSLVKIPKLDPLKFKQKCSLFWAVPGPRNITFVSILSFS